MTAFFNLRWLGAAIVARAESAIDRGLEETAARCVVFAKGQVRVRTATLQGSIRYEPPRGNSVLWGSFDVNYAIYQEMGTYKMAAKPYLRPAADAEYPQLASRIRAAMWS